MTSVISVTEEGRVTLNVEPEPTYVLTVESHSAPQLVLVEDSRPSVIVVQEQGPQGPRGAPGPPGSGVDMRVFAKLPDALVVGAITRNEDGLILSAPVVWPDGSEGIFSVDSIGELNTSDSYHVTHVDDSGTHTYTQPEIIRDASGIATEIPGIIVS